MPDRLLSLNGVPYPLAGQAHLERGARALQWRIRPSQPSDPSTPREARWSVSGPVGQSRERADGFLGPDYTQNLDTFYDNLVTSAPARNALTLTSSDPTAGVRTLPFLLPNTLGGYVAANVTHMLEQDGMLLFLRGVAATVVSPGDMSVGGTTILGSPVQGATLWFNKGRLGFGSVQPMATVTRVAANGVQVEPKAGEYATAMAVGAARWWGVNADVADATSGRLFFSVDDWGSFSTPFVAGDETVAATGMGTLGVYTVVGRENGAYSFTDNGSPQPVSRSMLHYRDADNHRKFVEKWGWLYTTTVRGLFALDIGGLVENPAGPEAMRGFELQVGRPTAIADVGDGLLAAYLTPGGNTYFFKGVFGRDTAATGRPDWYPFRYLASTTCEMVGATNLRTNPTIITGEGTNAAYFTMGRGGRDIADANYVFSTDGGTWFGSTMMRTAALHGNLRWASFITENCDANNTWQLAVSSDGGAYVNVGAAVTADGHQIVRPVSGGVPLSTVSFHTIKPRLTQVAASSSSPPQIRGPLTLVYDERPDQVREVQAVVIAGQRGRSPNTNIAALEALADHSQTTPIAVILPDDPGTTYYGVVNRVSVRDATGDDVRIVSLDMLLWETS